jgi:hypothetical protein
MISFGGTEGRFSVPARANPTGDFSGKPLESIRDSRGSEAELDEQDRSLIFR